MYYKIERVGSMLVKEILDHVLEKLGVLKWGRIEIIVRDAKVTQINTIEEERL